MFFNIIFHVGTKEKKNNLSLERTPSCDKTLRLDLMSWNDWLKEHQFYQVISITITWRVIYEKVSGIYQTLIIKETMRI